MSATGGYTSDVNLNDINYVGDFPAENNIGGFGTTTGSPNNYLLALTPPLTEPYRQGLLLQVKFHQLNTGPATLDVNGKGPVPLKKANSSGVLIDLAPGELKTTVHYLLVYDGTNFQVTNGIATGAGQATETNAGILKLATQTETNTGTNDQAAITPLKLKTRLDNYVNRENLLEIASSHIGSVIVHTPGRNKYTAVNGNLILPVDMRFQRASGPGVVSGWVLNLPKPFYTTVLNFSGILFSNLGEKFSYNINNSGRVFMYGTFIAPIDELLFDFKPYLAIFPLEYDPTSPP